MLMTLYAPADLFVNWYGGLCRQGSGDDAHLLALFRKYTVMISPCERLLPYRSPEETSCYTGSGADTPTEPIGWWLPSSQRLPRYRRLRA
jgi:hypothetical protein